MTHLQADECDHGQSNRHIDDEMTQGSKGFEGTTPMGCVCGCVCKSVLLIKNQHQTTNEWCQQYVIESYRTGYNAVGGRQ